VLLRHGKLVIHSYPAMLYLGLVLGTFAGSVAARGDHLDPSRFAITTIGLMVPALVGARLWFVLEHLGYYRRAPDRIWRRSEGGGALYGGLLLALIVSLPVLAAEGLPFGQFWDATAFTLLIGAIFTRVGCLLAGCCAGRTSDARIALRLPNRAGRWERRYPTQLLEILLAALLLGGALALRTHTPFSGALFVCVLGAYGVGRFALDFTRETARHSRRLTSAQIVSLAWALAAIGSLAIGGA
jgi:phosphatidylglycerol:prolipoprotein diacylglycerol transferase